MIMVAMVVMVGGVKRGCVGKERDIRRCVG